MTNLIPSDDLTGKDYAYAAAKAGIESIPFFGAAASELLGLLVASPLEKRKDEWMKKVGEKLIELEKTSKVNFTLLKDNQEFVDIVLQASNYALKTSDKEKIELLKNAIINTALGICPNQMLRQIFLNLVDNYTVLHIKVLSFFDNPVAWFESQNQSVPRLVSGSLLGILTDAYPNLRNQSELLNIVWSEMERSGLQNTGNLNTMMGGTSLLARRTTDMGRQFLDFILKEG